jgi:type II secretory pathway predicted ATPase ExeA
MLRAAFNLSTVPFAKDINVTDLFRHPQFDEMLRRLAFLFEHRGIGLFTGEVGCGKSTAVRTAVGTLSQQTHKVVYLCRNLDNVGAFYTHLALNLDLMPKFRKSDVETQVHTAIAELFHQQKVCTVIVIDEAQQLRPDILDQIRLLHNERFDSTDYLATALVGQPSLKKTIELNKFLPLRQRLTVSCHLPALCREDAYKYFNHHLALAKSATRIFMDNAVESIVAASKGIPRIINSIALKAMTLAANNKMTVVDQECVMRVLDELGLK